MVKGETVAVSVWQRLSDNGNFFVIVGRDKDKQSDISSVNPGVASDCGVVVVSGEDNNGKKFVIVESAAANIALSGKGN
ncbi:MAG: hypothetical protein V9G20_32700 [Candidatus Promineifilaceae bacterium]